MSSKATLAGGRLGIMGGYIHAATWQIVDTRQVALLLIFNVLQRFTACEGKVFEIQKLNSVSSTTIILSLMR